MIEYEEPWQYLAERNSHMTAEDLGYSPIRVPVYKNSSRSVRLPQDYVVGYAFRSDMGAVALIEKLQPAWQAGKLNGIGGKIEHGEGIHQAMAREFAEEAGVLIPFTRWLHFHTEQFMHTTSGKSDQFVRTRVYNFAVRTTAHEWSGIRTMEAEEIVKIKLPKMQFSVDGHYYPSGNFIYNMSYLIPMAATLLQQPPENRPQP